MSAQPLAQGTGVPFVFTPENDQKAQDTLRKYPADWSQSAVMPLLDLAQHQNGGWLSPEAIVYVAHYLSLPEIRVWEVATFYTMYQLKPVGKHLVNVCTTTPCWLRGSSKVMQACQKWLGIKTDETTRDGMFTLKEVECLGACANGPVVQINEKYYEDLDADSVASVLAKLAEEGDCASGSQRGRVSSEPTSVPEKR